MMLAMIASFYIFGIIQVFAHSTMLNVDYDNCQMANARDGIDEMWYALTMFSRCEHYPDDVSTIKYYFEETSVDGKTIHGRRMFRQP